MKDPVILSRHGWYLVTDTAAGVTLYSDKNKVRAGALLSYLRYLASTHPVVYRVVVDAHKPRQAAPGPVTEPKGG